MTDVARVQPAALAAGENDAVVAGAVSSVSADARAAASPPATGSTSLDSLVSTVICELGVPAVPNRFPTITTPIWCPASNVCSVGSSGIENAVFAPGVTRLAASSASRGSTSRGSRA